MSPPGQGAGARRPRAAAPLLGEVTRDIPKLRDPEGAMGMPCGPVLGLKGGTALQVKPSVGQAYLTTHAVMLTKTHFYQVRISTTLHDNEK